MQGCCAPLIWVVIMGGWVLYVVEDNMYVVEVVCEYECFRWERLVCSMATIICNFGGHENFGYPSGRVVILTCNGPLRTLAPIKLHFPSPSSGLNEPSI